MGRLIDKDKLIVEYDKAHEGPPGGARKLMKDAEDVPAIPLDWTNFEPNDEEKECGYFGMTYFHIVQVLFLWNTSHSGGTSTIQKCRELGIKDWSEGVRFKLWEGEADGQAD